MKFEERQFSRRFPKVCCALFVVHEKCVPDTDIPPHLRKYGVPLWRATAAALIDKRGDVYIGVSLCAPGDQFIKATGRQKAIGRAFSLLIHEAEPHLRVGLTSEGRTRTDHVDAIQLAIADAIQAKRRQARRG